MEVWDPIGLKDELLAQDEYDAYLGDLYELLIASASDSEVAKYLYWVAHERMGFEEERARDTRTTVMALKRIDIRPQK